MEQREADVAWEGDCLEIIRRFPRAIRADIGADIRRLQVGEKPINSRSMKSVGRGVFELRQRDGKGWYRLIYLAKLNDSLYMLHAFVKKSAKTSRNDLAIASARLKAVKARFLEEKNARKRK